MTPMSHVSTYTESPHYSIPTGSQYANVASLQQPIPQYSLPNIPIIEAGTASPNSLPQTEHIEPFNHTMYNIYNYISSSRLVSELYKLILCLLFRFCIRQILRKVRLTINFEKIVLICWRNLLL